MLLDRSHRKGCGLLFSLSLIPWKRHPFPDYCSSRIVLGLHLHIPSSSMPPEIEPPSFELTSRFAPQALDLR
jgi:hypothetical protein